MRRVLVLFVFGCVLLAGHAGLADSVRTDANIITGLDLSGSIETPDAQLQMDGIAMAIRSPQIIAAIQHGNYGRIGFAVFVWADGNHPVLDSWRLIGSAEEALAVSEEISAQLRAIRRSDVVVKLGALTDVSGAIDYGAEMLKVAPFATSRRIINIISNGVDNVGEHAWLARDRAVAQGVTINGVALGRDRTIYDYFKREVIGGPQSFVFAATDTEHLVEVLARKFTSEIVSNGDSALQASR